MHGASIAGPLATKPYRRAKYWLSAKHAALQSFLPWRVRYRPFWNVNGADERGQPKRALLIYLTKLFSMPPTDPRLLTHQNTRQCRQIAGLLGELGYVVDAVDVRDRGFVPSKHYDLVISNKSDLLGMEAYFPARAVKIFLASVTGHRLHNQRLRRRHERLRERRGCAVRLRRVYNERMSFAAGADAIVGFGNHAIMDTWRDIFDGPIYAFNNYGFNETNFLSDGKDFAEARRHFLFFASASQMQKGLDLLLEVFPPLPHLHLYICGPFERERDFCRYYRTELGATPNIHAQGWVQVNSPEYEKLLRKCAYVIHPTCSEGQSGSVVQCMYSGLIPLLTREAGIDTEDFGVTFRDDSLEEIERVVREVSELSEEWHREHSSRTRRAAETKYSEDAFLKRWREILGEILGRDSCHNTNRVARISVAR